MLTARFPRLPLLPLLAEAALLLLLAWIALRLLPFARLAGWLQPKVTGSPRPDSLRLVVRAVRAAARRVPFPAVCFPQGIAVQTMLCRRGIPAVLRYGVRKTAAGKMEAHVWVTVDDQIIIGGETAGGFTLMTSFSPRRG